MTTWERLGGVMASTPAVTSWAENEMQVFAIGPDGVLSSIYWDGAAWHDWHGHGGSFTGSPAVCSKPRRVNVRMSRNRSWQRASAPNT